ncbi:MAG: carbohydrate-binding family 9-like protein [Phycisphaerales bacterium]|nr:carbohydrate-binding family 9-like protein [Phycisphaerales bacterium]
MADECKVGRHALKIVAEADAQAYRGVEFQGVVDLTGAGPGDKLTLWVKQDFGTGMVIQIWMEQGNVNRAFALKHDQWTRIELDLDLKHWENPHGLTQWGKISRIQFYANAFSKPRQYMILDGFSLTAGGKIAGPIEAERITKWTFPQETITSWLFGNEDAAWIISKSTGQVVGGWDAKTKSCYLKGIEGRYFLEDRKSLTLGLASQDKIIRSQFNPDEQRLEITCSNATVPDLIITKRYWLSGNKLYQRTAFLTRNDELQFITYNNQAIFDKGYRDAGYYMGGGDGGFPLLPAPKLSSWHKVLEYQNTTKGMVLSQPEVKRSFAHIRTRLDDQFVWPWFTGAIASYCEAENVLNYTPDGWDMSLGTSRLSRTKEISYEQYFSIFQGEWYDFLSREYPSLPEVKEAYALIPPTPDWVADIKADTFSDIHKLKHLLAMTDEGYITVLVDIGGSWADYYVDQGLEGGYAGGGITGPELKDLIRRLKALSPRIKVGIYMWDLSTLENTRIFKHHPEWFRKVNKEGDQISTFPGLATNFAQLLSIPECYNALLSQFDLILSYLDTDFIYLDDPKAINPIDWPSGQYTRDDLSYRFMLDIKKIAAKHGPDKMVFFNNRGNPYADINYIEARGQMNPEYWRVFSGIATIIETNLNVNPKARIVPLYYTSPYQREYVNRVLAMGWIPEASSSNATEMLEHRAFYQAAYEIGNCDIVPARYSPDWKRDRETKVESYPMQRRGDSGYLFSFISHHPDAVNVPVDLDLRSLNVNTHGQVYIWKYVIENGLEFKGTVTEHLAREAYEKTGWLLDHVTRRELVYAGPYRESLSLNIAMEPLILNQLYVTTQSAAVYSENNLPGNYLFGEMPRVVLHENDDRDRGTIEIQVKSDRDQVEIISFLSMSRHHLNQVLLDGRTVPTDYVWEGNDVFPLIRVGRGEHAVTLQYAPKNAAAPAAIEDMGVSFDAEKQPQVTLNGYDKALLTVSKHGRMMFNRMVGRSSDGRMIIPLAVARGGMDEYVVEVRAVLRDDGSMQLASSSPVKLQLPASEPDNHLPPLAPPLLPGSRQIAEINRDINGLRVLRSAAVTTDTIRGTFQPDLQALMATVHPEQLMLEAGTTRKIEYTTRGAAFSGLEIDNLRKVKVTLKNTFYDAFHLFGKGIHIPPWNTSTSNFAGIVVDYHTSAGYTKRVRLATGVLHDQCSSINPDYGKSAIADECFDLGKSLIETPQSTFSLDLERYAPQGWDGRVWLSVGSDWIASDRRLTLQILAANEAVTGDCLTPANPNAFRERYETPKTMDVPRSPGGILIDGVINEEMWRGAARTDEFFLIGGKGISQAKTEALLLYDDTHLYVAFTCAEPSRRRPLVQGGAVWDDDEVEVWIDAEGQGKDYRQVLVNSINNKLEYSPGGATRIGVVSAVDVIDGRSWSVEMMIPYKGLGVNPPKPGDHLRISLCRYRPAGRNFNDEQIVWAPLHAEGFKDLEHFGTLNFK